MPEEDRGWADAAIALVDPRRGLWRMIPSPLIAAVHFAIFYIGTSVYCIRSESGDLEGIDATMTWLTLAAAAAIAALAWVAWRRLRLVRSHPDSPLERRDQVAFMARITLYLALLSLVGVLFVASPLLVFDTCR